MTKLFRVGTDGLVAARATRLATESQLEGWVYSDAGIIGLDVLIVGRQVVTDHGGRIDLLAIERSGNLAVIELKRDRTPREVIAQALDYASWVARLTTADVHRIARQHMDEKLETAFRAKFDESLPEALNETHSIVIVASEFDASSRRIVEYLAEKGGIAINTAFFAVFDDAGSTYVATDWLLDQEEVIERSVDRSRAPWSGLWYANVGDGRTRAWEDMRRYGFLAAGGGRTYSGKLGLLSVGDRVFAYQRGAGYVGFGTVTKPATSAREFETSTGPLLKQPLTQPNFVHDEADAELAEYAVGIEWAKTFPISEAKAFAGVFANQNIVCKLRHAATIEFLTKEFGPIDHQ